MLFCLNQRYFTISVRLQKLLTDYYDNKSFRTADDVQSRMISPVGDWGRKRERKAPSCLGLLNPLTPNDHYSGRTAPLTSTRRILCIYSTNIGTEYFKHDIYSPFFPLQNAFCFIILTYLVPVLFTFYIQRVLKLRKIIPAPKG